MTRYLLDSGIASDLINRRGLVPVRVREARLRGDRVGLGTPVLGELIAGIQNSNDPPRQLATMWRNLGRLTLWTFDRAAALEFGRVYAELRRVGRIMQVPDLQIAAIALSLGNCVVVSKDSDLRAVPGLTVEDWSRP
ncbi:MAG: type II toxin-antitoxin system VapC family toxin [Verrucomicrobia bacterium]|nr:type II toxin-antitoxin system VapC family toxin [Verrucomicrobiota bacterium]